MIGKTCCFSGHRFLPEEVRPALSCALERELKKMIEEGVAVFRNGGALGFDTLAALLVLDLKASYPQLRLIMDLPCRSQSNRFSPKDRAIYDYILSRADKVAYTSLYYYHGCMLARNRHMVDQSDVLISYLREPTGGTAYTVHYAESKGIPVIRL